jgi:hypothetical protein
MIWLGISIGLCIGAAIGFMFAAILVAGRDV